MPVPSGKVFDFQPESAIRTDFLETFMFKQGVPQLIQAKTNEFSAVCPFSGLPDIAIIEILYYPDGGLCIELKSLKYYFVSFRNVGIYQEAVTKRVYNDLKEALNTKRLKVITIYKTRGGIDVVCEAGEVRGTGI